MILKSGFSVCALKTKETKINESKLLYVWTFSILSRVTYGVSD